MARCLCGNEAQSGRSKCSQCRSFDRRVDRKINPAVKENEKKHYDAKKDDPTFKDKNRKRASDWNKKNPDKKNESNRKSYHKKKDK